MTDEEHLNEIHREVCAHLDRCAMPVTARNVIHAMFNLRYADWLGGDDVVPTCPMEYSYADGL